MSEEITNTRGDTFTRSEILEDLHQRFQKGYSKSWLSGVLNGHPYHLTSDSEENIQKIYGNRDFEPTSVDILELVREVTDTYDERPYHFDLRDRARTDHKEFRLRLMDRGSWENSHSHLDGFRFLRGGQIEIDPDGGAGGKSGFPLGKLKARFDGLTDSGRDSICYFRVEDCSISFCGEKTIATYKGVFPAQSDKIKLVTEPSIIDGMDKEEVEGWDGPFDRITDPDARGKLHEHPPFSIGEDEEVDPSGLKFELVTSPV